MSEDDFLNFDKDYQAAECSIDNRKMEVEKVIQRLETDMEFLAVTGVEDILQDKV